jgi:D-alanine transfer protein
MKKISVFLLVSVAFIGITYGVLTSIDKFYDNRIASLYQDHMGDRLSDDKNKGIAMQLQSLSRNDNIQIFGSSELGSTGIPTHPSIMFANKAMGFQVNLIGTGHSQSFIHAVNMGAVSEKLNGNKVVFIISPQWFTKEGLSQYGFDYNFSELQFYNLMFNDRIDADLKARIAKRTSSFAKQNSSYTALYQYSSLYTKEDFISKTEILILTPCIKFKHYLLSLRDKVQAYNIIKSLNNPNAVPSQEMKKSIDWNQQLIRAEELGKQSTQNNDFGIQNEYYNTYIKEKFNSLKGSYKEQSYSESQEYDDLKLLLDLCRSQDIKPLFVSVPVNGKWYDYCEFSKDDRNKYYKQVNTIVSSYGFDLLDLSSHEYEDYCLKDIMHLGWKGWIYIDKAIDQYYNKH